MDDAFKAFISHSWENSAKYILKGMLISKHKKGLAPKAVQFERTLDK